MTIISDDQKHTLEDSGFDRLLRRKDAVQEEQERSEQQIKDRRVQQEQSERLRIARIGASGKDTLTYTIDEVINQCILYKGSQNISIDFHSLGFPDNRIGATQAYDLLQQMQEYGGFSRLEKSTNTVFIVSKPNINLLKDFKASRLGKKEQGESLHEGVSTIPTLAGTKWEDITFRFKDGHTLDISVKGEEKKYRRDYKDMGFENKRSFKPDQQWSMLLAFSENSCELPYNEKYKTKKYNLSEGLKKIFPELGGSPIRYRRRKTEKRTQEEKTYEYLYQCRINVIPIGGLPTYNPKLLGSF